MTLGIGLWAERIDCFSGTYAEARRRFLDVADSVGARVESITHPTARGLQNEDLAVDTAFLGPARSSRALVVLSGTHGVEGHCGSAVQIDFMRSAAGRPSEQVLLVFVHALNPYGFSYSSRTDENNVDVNRNFVDHRGPYARNSDYAELHQLLLPDRWVGMERERADHELRTRVASAGAKKIQAALQGGQWERSDGLFYGGHAPSWSNRVLRGLLAEHLRGRHHVGVIDVHTGLGTYACAERIFRGRHGEEGLARARAWYGNAVTTASDEDSSSQPISGNIAVAFDQGLPECQLTAITLELGTRPLAQVLHALRGDVWLKTHACDEATATEIRAATRNAFFCQETDWRTSVLEAGTKTIELAMAGLLIS